MTPRASDQNEQRNDLTEEMRLENGFVTRIRDNAEQLLDTIASDRRDDPELRKMGADGIDHRSSLADEQVTGTVQR